MQGQSTHDTHAGEREKRFDEPDEGHGMAPGPGIQGNQSKPNVLTTNVKSTAHSYYRQISI